MFYNKSITGTVYIINQNRVLLHVHKKYNTWFPIGGHVEQDEFPSDAVKREAKEEAGLEIKIVNTEHMPETDIGRVVRVPLPFCTYNEGKAGDEEFFDFIYIAETEQTEPHAGTGESNQFKWFTLQELKEATGIKPHVRNTAIRVLEYYSSNNEIK